MGHDQRFKELLRLFLRPFLEHFFPEIAGHLDLSSPEFVDKELFEDPPEGSRRVADLVARVTTQDGEPEMLLVHIEVQADRKSDVPAQMFDYYTLIRRTYRLPVVPLVIYLRGGRDGLTHEEYRDTLFGRETLRFRYDCLALALLDAEEHVGSDEALLAGLAALMDRSGVNQPLRLRLSMLNRIGRSPYDSYRKFLLTNLVEVYFELGENEVERFREVLSHPEFKEANEMASTYAERLLEEGREEGRQQGRSEGLVHGKQETLLRLSTKKFGALPEQLVTRVQAMTSNEALDALLDQVLVSDSLDEMDLPS